MKKSVIMENLGTRNLFVSDVKFLQSKGLKPRAVAAEALHIYCNAWRTQQWLPKMTKEERDRFILTGKLEIETFPPQPDSVNSIQVIERPSISTIAAGTINRPSAAAMRDWSKIQRDVYILYGTV